MQCSVPLIWPKRHQAVHKYQVGVVGLWVGSEQFPGAAILAARAAYRAGAGMVVVMGHPNIKNSLIQRCPEVVFVALPVQGKLCLRSAERVIVDTVLKYNIRVLGIGSGFGTHFVHPFIFQSILNVLLELGNVKLILDAETLQPETLSILKRVTSTEDVLLTPHVGEFKRLLSIQSTHLTQKELFLKYASNFPCAFILKGAPSLVLVNESAWECPIINASLATAGSGDVLLGLIAAMLLQGLSLFQACQASVFLHVYTAQIFEENQSGMSMMASDSIDLVGAALARLSACE